MHEQHAAYDDDLDDVGLTSSLADAADDERHDERVRASHDEAQRRVGTEVGSLVTAFVGAAAYFGPVVVPVPTFSELKTARAAF